MEFELDGLADSVVAHALERVEQEGGHLLRVARELTHLRDIRGSGCEVVVVGVMAG